MSKIRLYQKTSSTLSLNWKGVTRGISKRSKQSGSMFDVTSSSPSDDSVTWENVDLKNSMVYKFISVSDTRLRVDHSPGPSLFTRPPSQWTPWRSQWSRRMEEDDTPWTQSTSRSSSAESRLAPWCRGDCHSGIRGGSPDQPRRHERRWRERGAQPASPTSTRWWKGNADKHPQAKNDYTWKVKFTTGPSPAALIMD